MNMILRLIWFGIAVYHIMNNELAVAVGCLVMSEIFSLKDDINSIKQINQHMLEVAEVQLKDKDSSI